MIEESEEVKKAHIWQNFRLQCITLAIQSGAEGGKKIVKTADIISEFILEKSKRELANEVKK